MSKKLIERTYQCPDHGEQQMAPTCLVCLMNLEEQAHKANTLRKSLETAKDERDRYLDMLKHTHVAGRDGDIDKCHKCGMDLRHPIHKRMEAK